MDNYDRHYNKSHEETGIYFTSTDFVFTEDELKSLSELFATRKNFYDIEEEFIVTIMDNYERFAKHKELSASIAKQIGS
jgi:outer membrane usher protein FimD/PapC